MRYAKSFLVAFMLALAAFAGSPTQGGTVNASIVLYDADGNIIDVFIGVNAQGGVDFV